MGSAGTAGTQATGAAGALPVGNPASCSAAASPYKVQATALDPSIVPATFSMRGAGGGDMRAIVAIDPATNRAYVGTSKQDGSSFASVIAPEGGSAAETIVIPSSVLGGLAITKDGFGALVYDPAAVDQRLWAAVKRLSSTGAEQFSTELFHSANLMDDMTRGNPTRGRLAYVAASDQLVAYFGHNEMLQMVRHQGGYLASLSATGMQTVLAGWFGSHNLDQRLVVDDTRVAVIGLGDAFPKGIFFSLIDKPKTNVIYAVAATGDGSANAQLGDLIALSDAFVTSFATNRSLATTVDPGAWPNIDQTIAMQIRTAAAAGTDVGLLVVPKTGAPAGGATPVWVDIAPAAGARIANLHAARYGTGDQILLAWAEQAGSQFTPTSAYYTMVVDRAGAVCQAKQPLDAANAFGADDFERRADGAIVWANASAGQIHVVTLAPQ
jgi:hypothetical protein